MPMHLTLPPPPSLPPPPKPTLIHRNSSPSPVGRIILLQGIAPHVFPHYRGGRRLTYYRRPSRRQSRLRFTTSPCLNKCLGDDWFPNIPSRPISSPPNDFPSPFVQKELDSSFCRSSLVASFDNSDYDICQSHGPHHHSTYFKPRHLTFARDPYYSFAHGDEDDEGNAVPSSKASLDPRADVYYDDVLNLIGDYFSRLSIAVAMKDPNEQIHAYVHEITLI